MLDHRDIILVVFEYSCDRKIMLLKWSVRPWVMASYTVKISVYPRIFCGKFFTF